MGFGLLRVIHTSLNFGTRDVGFDCRHSVEGGEQTMGREWPDLGGPALPYAQESPTRRDPYFCSPVRGSHRKTDTAFILPVAAEENIDR